MILGQSGASDSIDLSGARKRRRVPEDSENGRSPQGPPPHYNQQPQRLFACPYYKSDPARYTNNQISCSRVLLTSIPRVKQHLYRVHCRMKDSLTYQSNSIPRASPATPLPDSSASSIAQSHGSKRSHDPSVDITDEQWLQLKVKRPRLDPKDAWYEIFTTLCPGSALPASPYVDDNFQASRFVEQFRNCSVENFSQLVHKEVHAQTKFAQSSLQCVEPVAMTEDFLNTAITVILDEFHKAFVQRQSDGEGSTANQPASLPSYTAAVQGNILTRGDKSPTRVDTQAVVPASAEPFTYITTFDHFPTEKSSLGALASINDDVLGSDVFFSEDLDTTPISMEDQAGMFNCTDIPTMWGNSPVDTELEELDRGKGRRTNNSKFTQSSVEPFRQNKSDSRHAVRQNLVDTSSVYRSKRHGKPSGKALQPMSCISIKTHHKEQCPDECLTWSNIDIYSVQRHEETKHPELYTRAQALLLKGIGKKKDAESRWLAWWEIAAGEEHKGQISPYYQGPDLDESHTALPNKNTLSEAINGETPTSLERLQVYKALQDRIAEKFESRRITIEKHRQDAEQGLTSHIRQVLDSRKEIWIDQDTLAKCEALKSLTRDYEAGKTIVPEEVVARCTSQSLVSPFDYHEILSEMSATYDFDFSNCDNILDTSIR